MSAPIPAPPPDASSTKRGLVNLVSQAFTGVKTFLSGLVSSGSIVVAGVSSGSHALMIPEGSRLSSSNGHYVENLASGWRFGDDGRAATRILYLGSPTATGGQKASIGDDSIARIYFEPSGVSGKGGAVNIVGRNGVDSTAIGVILGTDRTQSVAGAKLVSIRNYTAEKAYVDINGGVVAGSFFTTGSLSGSSVNSSGLLTAGSITTGGSLSCGAITSAGISANGQVSAGGTNGFSAGTGGVGVAASSIPLNFQTGWGLSNATGSECFRFFSTTGFTTRAKLLALRKGSTSSSTLVASVDVDGLGTFGGVTLSTGSLQFSDGTIQTTAAVSGTPLEIGKTDLTSDYTLLKGGSETLPFDTAAINVGGGFDAATDAYDNPSNGYCEVSTVVTAYSNGGGSQIEVIVTSNGSTCLKTTVNLPTTLERHTITLSGIVPAAASTAIVTKVSELLNVNDVVLVGNQCHMSVKFLG